ncbi:hypothetical protein HYU16_00545 [Candidatus Woesearchaeota archaeon]|nr:hypothetical protein [Candidatus Woesearchaeota archaeon]
MIALVVSLTFLSYLVFANATEIQEIVNRLATGEKSLSHIAYEERVKHVTGVLLSMNRTSQVFEKLTGPEKHELSVELIEPVTQQGTHLKVNGEDVYLASGGTSYVSGWLTRHRGNFKDLDGVINSNIDTFYVGSDHECSLADHYECVDGNLHWLYCNGTDYGQVEECDSCSANECIKKGTFARWERMKVHRESINRTSE